MFTSHLDTATKANNLVNHVFDGKTIKQTVINTSR
jgi:type VI protein secretion system component Hcp